jgi:hypothetical protein
VGSVILPAQRLTAHDGSETAIWAAAPQRRTLISPGRGQGSPRVTLRPAPPASSGLQRSHLRPDSSGGPTFPVPRQVLLDTFVIKSYADDQAGATCGRRTLTCGRR